MSSRITPQGSEKNPESRFAPDFSKFNVHDSFTSSISSSGGEERRHLSRQQLEEVEARLGERDRQILTAIQRYRYLLTGQIERRGRFLPSLSALYKKEAEEKAAQKPLEDGKKMI